ncbi:hypothetical protein DAEQUDRAFT_540987 [Daedalea quercina L-15889]|uniref:Uncharacterized protein n=1 Tax=Daedalea quercina L-15889 TaxID=1314783 RepID=A0A165M3U3_9APHY|nr:hypothetical protein DAEQUDRAFT_540987 [Daedalea quercina L-15889]
MSSNTSLEELDLQLYICTPVTDVVESAFETLIPSITSPHLKRINVVMHPHEDPSQMVLALQDANDTRSLETESDGYDSAFHAILRSSSLDQSLSKEAPLCITFSIVFCINPWGIMGMMKRLKSHVFTLFKPWLDREIMHLNFRPDPEYGQLG